MDYAEYCRALLTFPAGSEERIKLVFDYPEFAKLSGEELPKGEVTADFFAKQIVLDLHHIYHVVIIPELKGQDLWDSVRWFNPEIKQWETDIAVLVEFVEREVPKYKTKAGDPRVADMKTYKEIVGKIGKLFPVPLKLWNTHIAFPNGIWEEGKLRPTKWDDYQLRIYPFALAKKESLHPERWLGKLQEATADWAIILHYLGSCLRRDPSEYGLFFLGTPSTGKSPWLRVIRAVIGEENVGSDSFVAMGDKSGLSTMWDKVMNLDTDANMSYLPNSSIAIIKKIFGDDKTIPVRLLFRDTFLTEISPYMVIGTNQMPKMNVGVDADGVFKRFFMCEFTKKFADDPKFKEWLMAEETIAEIGSYCFLLPKKSWRDDMGVELFIKMTKDRWMNSAYPVRTILNGLIQRSFDPDSIITRSELAVEVSTALADKGITIPVNLTSEITEAIHLMGGDKCQRDKRPAYEGIEWLTPTSPKFVMTEEDEVITDEILKELRK
jgi:hypothetical protein